VVHVDQVDRLDRRALLTAYADTDSLRIETTTAGTQVTMVSRPI
jgi:hypothetical protein